MFLRSANWKCSHYSTNYKRIVMKFSGELSNDIRNNLFFGGDLDHHADLQIANYAIYIMGVMSCFVGDMHSLCALGFFCIYLQICPVKLFFTSPNTSRYSVNKCRKLNF